MELPNKQTILILPAVSSGNVPQLALDLIVHSFNVPFAGIIDHKGLLYPFAGPSERWIERDTKAAVSAGNGISSALEIYHNSKITCLIQRSPTLPGCKDRFVNDILLPLIEKNEFTKILLLSSSDAARRSNPAGSKVMTILPSSGVYDIDSNEAIEALTKRIDLLSVSDSGKLNAERAENYKSPRLPGSGITRRFLEAATKHNLPVIALVMFAFDGDNFSDAYVMAGLAIKLLSIDTPASWTEPVSWKGVYGKEPRIGLEYGLYG
ncbi:PAC2 family-domain-containing protein [Dipodascopsis uninucleata]